MENLVIDAPAPPLWTEARVKPPQRVLVTGGDGYIGNILAPRLLAEGYDVTVMDAGFYRGAWLYHDGLDRAPVLTRDTREITPDDLRGFDAIVHLAELSNDPMCEHDENLTIGINHLGSVWEHDPGTDFDAIDRGMVSITPLHLDMTDYKAFDVLKPLENIVYQSLPLHGDEK